MYNPKYFTLYELLHSTTALKKGIDNSPEDFNIVENLSNLCQWLDLFRQTSGKAIKINSGYRCRSLNSVLPGSAANSWHIYGKAADIRFVNGNLTDLWNTICSVIGLDSSKYSEYYEDDQFEIYKDSKDRFIHFACKR